ncbi:hypothetical protein P3T37_006090 [Kitasatospora sp. MAA4]|nr:hypothetical protein [Kitasatospora sp. MAA4]
MDVRARIHQGLVEHLVLTLGGDGFMALGIMNRMSGSTEEVLDAVRSGKTLTAHDALRTHELCELIVQRVGE